MANLERELIKLRAGKISWPEFHKRTHDEWHRLAHKLWRTWSREAAAAVDVDDVEQDMLLGAWEALRQYDPNRGVSLKSFVVWTAMSGAKVRLHKARGAVLHGTRENNPSRRERNEASLARGDHAPQIEDMARAEPEQERVLRLRDALKAAGIESSAVAVLLRTGDANRAARKARRRGGNGKARLREAVESALRAL